MDVETSEAIEGLTLRIDALREDLAAQGTSLNGATATLGAQLRTEMAQLGTELRTEMADQGAQLRAEIRGVLIQLESVRDDIRIVAEGVANLAVKFDRRT